MDVDRKAKKDDLLVFNFILFLPFLFLNISKIQLALFS